MCTAALMQASALYGDDELIDFILSVVKSKNDFLKEALIEFLAVFPHDKLTLISSKYKIFKKAKKLIPNILKDYIDESLKYCNVDDQLLLVFKLMKAMNSSLSKSINIIRNSQMILTSPSINLDRILPQLITNLENGLIYKKVVIYLRCLKFLRNFDTLNNPDKIQILQEFDVSAYEFFGAICEPKHYDIIISTTALHPNKPKAIQNFLSLIPPNLKDIALRRIQSYP